MRLFDCFMQALVFLLKVSLLLNEFEFGLQTFVSDGDAGSKSGVRKR